MERSLGTRQPIGFVMVSIPVPLGRVLRRFGREPVDCIYHSPCLPLWENIGCGSENTQGCEAGFLPKRRVSLDKIPLNNLIIDKICLNVNGVNLIRV